MRLSLEWLADYVDLPPAEKLAERLTMAGLEVEGLERPGDALKNVVIAKVLQASPIEGTHLSACRVFDGTLERAVVCGAPNVAAGQTVVLAIPGATVGGKAIVETTIRGQKSQGMICSERELGLSENHAGILVLPENVAAGTPAARALDLDDLIFEVKATPNRPDWLSHVGVAREIAALTGAALRLPALTLAENGPPISDAARVTVEDHQRCGRYVARVIEGVKIGPSPRWLVRRLEAAGVRALSNVVDITNYVLMELGQPLHAFDLDRVKNGHLIVRAARAGEPLTTLDGKARKLDADDLVIADASRPIALAGVMGGATSEVSADTTRVLLESASFTPAGIRRTARRHALHSEASHRFERGADPEIAAFAADRAAALMSELCGGTIRRGRIDLAASLSKREIALRAGAAKRLLGIDISSSEQSRMLTALGCKESTASVWQGPSWRPDLREETDLVEEIGRLHGYDRVPAIAPPMSALPTPTSADDEAISAARNSLSASGFSEAVNYSFTAPALLAALGANTGAIAIANPLTALQSAMRTTLVASLCENLQLNLARGATNIRLYELGRVYCASGNADRPANEPRRVGLLLFGAHAPLGWATEKSAADFYDLKAAAEALAASLGRTLSFAPTDAPHLHPVSASAAILDGTVVGTLGELHPAAAQKLSLPRGVWVAELDADALFAAARLQPRLSSVMRFPAVLRDLAIVVDETITATDVARAIRADGGSLLEAATLFDVYRGAPLPSGQKNLAYSLAYRASDRTLTDVEVNTTHERILAGLTRSVGAKLRA